MRSTGSWYEIITDQKEIFKGRLPGKFKLKNFKVTNPIAVGDYVDFTIENTAERTVLIEKIHPRENYMIRKSVHKTGHGHMIAANIDQSILVVTLVLPRTSLGFIDRFLVSCEAFRIPAVLVFNKIDLYDEALYAYQQDLINIYEGLGYKCILTSVQTGQGIEEFKNILKNKKSLISGHSGVGKSSLVNLIAPDLELKTGDISDFSLKGKHTTTFAEMFELEPGTYIIDTPGIKELGIFDMEEEEISHYFPEMRELLGHCRFHNCKHFNEPGCTIIQQVEKGEIALSRYESYLSMLINEDTRR
ncbi:ribosome small subunit-dependent GTPase A [Sporocytophaga sp.]|uniref:ribosome small subunit-dependent GTPase A n=1 Tax=Sporocytophaga sp. TaxID=2231183 RepID=UPI0025EF51FE|nr:ribosome small subunit-dependent GTPase A [Sporocytophaga sp.]